MKIFRSVTAVFLALCASPVLLTLGGCVSENSGTPAVSTVDSLPQTSAVTEAPLPVKVPAEFDMSGGQCTVSDGEYSALDSDVFTTLLSSGDSGEEYIFSCNMTFVSSGTAGIILGYKDAQNFWSVSISSSGKLFLYRTENNKRTTVGMRNIPVTVGEAVTLSAERGDGYLRIYCSAAGEDPGYQLIDIKADSLLTPRLTGLYFGNACAVFSDCTLSLPAQESGTDTYTNPVAAGADPDILFDNGVYYLYNRVSDGYARFKCSKSTDLVNFEYCCNIFQIDPAWGFETCMSPNVCKYDGIYYLFFAASTNGGTFYLYCASSESPEGPFTFKTGTPVPLHADVSEIGGHPFIDDDGSTYLTLVRFGGGNHIWIVRTGMADGTVTCDDKTLRKLISPDRDYEIDTYGKISEGGVIIKHNSLYYMIYATGHYKGEYGEGYAVAETVYGPYTKYKFNDILASTEEAYGVGDGIIVPSPDGTELFMVYHRHYKNGTIEPRMTCIDRIAFTADPDGGCDILTVCGPTATKQPMPSA